ncbi:hypothetical protein DDE20_05570 [Pararhodobacter oceanensis]|uniref:Uncharacterized protein n=1 Tax=Pararhodobacter oceanensis TaxID=2172121 RepID=A0A2T8HW25_9RHOB|nr:hypothetical protein DDE20_05570 [Pararhodobacter oceanensis]
MHADVNAKPDRRGILPGSIDAAYSTDNSIGKRFQTPFVGSKRDQKTFARDGYTVSGFCQVSKIIALLAARIGATGQGAESGAVRACCSAAKMPQPMPRSGGTDSGG